MSDLENLLREVRAPDCDVTVFLAVADALADVDHTAAPMLCELAQTAVGSGDAVVVLFCCTLFLSILERERIIEELP